MPLKEKTKLKLNMAMRNMMALTVMMAICIGSVITVMAKTVDVTIVDNGQKSTVSMMDPTEDSIVETAEQYQKIQPVKEKDQVAFDPETNTLTIRRAADVTVTADGKSHTVTVHYGDTLGDAISKAGVTYGSDDVLSADKDQAVTGDTSVSITRYYHVAVTADGETDSLLVKEGDVASALSEASVKLGDDDLVNEELDAALTEGMEIKVSRVTYKEVSKEEKIAFTTKKENSDSLYKGETKVKTKGEEGSRTIVTRQKLVDGKVVETEEVSNTITKQPVAQVELVGTKSRPTGVASVSANGTLVDHNGNRVSYKQAFTGRCTAYTGGGWTATGRPAQFGNIAVNPKQIPYGSRLYICSPDGKLVYGYATAADTGGFASKGYIMADLYYDTYNQCANFGVRNMTIYVLS
jgi:uncharacterized protein YabE (DUF348 family)/3D (Asp-Asp-Asp) domain-containing protein